MIVTRFLVLWQWMCPERRHAGYLERGEQIMLDVERQTRLRHAAEAAGVISLGKERVLRRRRAHLRRSGRPPKGFRSWHS